MNEDKFGKCDCGGTLYPIYYTLYETTDINGNYIRTGRKKRAVSHLVCDSCLKNICIDDSFDEGYWH